MSMTQEELERLTQESREHIEETKRAFKELELARYMKPTVEELLEQGHKWKKWYAWRPVKDIHGCWHWHKEIFRLRGNTYVDYDNWNWYYYGTIFDVLQK